MEEPQQQGGRRVDRPILTPHDGGAENANYSTDDLMNEVFDLMRRRLPRLNAGDPGRARLMALLPQIGAALGRDQVVPVPEDRARQSA